VPSEILLKTEKHTLVLEGIGESKIRVNASGWDDAKVLLPDELLEVRANGKQPHVLRKPRRPDEVDTPHLG
jgi:hypothetical protein